MEIPYIDAKAVMKVSKVFPLIGALIITGGTMAPSQAQPNLRTRPDFFEQGQKQFEDMITDVQKQQSERGYVSPLTIQSGGFAWTNVILKEANCSVVMPQGVVSSETKIIPTALGDIKFSILASMPPGTRFIVAYSEPLPAAMQQSPTQVLNQVQQRIAGNRQQFQLSQPKAITVQGNPGRSFLLTDGKETINFQLILAQERLYVMAVNDRADKVSDTVVQAFFNSFQLLAT